MPLKKKSLSEMTKDSLRYLAENTNITYFAQGSVSKALIEATNLEISRLQDFVSTTFDNGFLSTASGIYLDLFGEMLNTPRIRDRAASSSAEDGAVRFYVDSGTLGSKLPSLIVANKGTIPSGTRVSTKDGSITYYVSNDVTFPINARSVFVPVSVSSSGSSYNVGANQLTTHSLSSSDIKVTNDLAITSGTDVESDAEYRYRLSKAMTTKFGANRTAIQVAASSQPGVSRADVLPFTRGSGTFDVLLIPQGNRLTVTAKEDTRRAIEQVTAFGVSPRILEPVYVPFRIIVQLIYQEGTAEGQKITIRTGAESAILRYFASIPIGGEVVMNQIRAAVLTSNTAIKDMRIVELCIDNHQRTINNVQLEKDELLVPDSESDDSVKVV